MIWVFARFRTANIGGWGRSVPSAVYVAHVDVPHLQPDGAEAILSIIASAWTPPPSPACQSFDLYCVQGMVEDGP